MVPIRRNSSIRAREVPVEYGVDVSLPIHHKAASVNYPWLQHNVDSTAPTPHKNYDMVIQPLEINRHFTSLSILRQALWPKGKTLHSDGKRSY
jgi:hypothetical protein